MVLAKIITVNKIWVLVAGKPDTLVPAKLSRLNLVSQASAVEGEVVLDDGWKAEKIT